MKEKYDYILPDKEKRYKLFFKTDQMEILDLKITINEIKTSLERLNSRFEVADERISKFEDKLTDIMQLE